MKLFLVLCAVVALASAQDCGKLLASIDDNNVDLPWVVKLTERSSEDLLCMGTLISKQHVLIAAHCLFPKPYMKSLMDTTNVQVRVGKDVFDLMDVKIHPEWKFNKDTYDADVAILTLFNPVTFSSRVQPICLPSAASDDAVVPKGVFAGLNSVNRANIRHRVVIEKNNACFQKFPTSLKGVSPRTFCANWPGEELEVADGTSGAYFYPVGDEDNWFVQGVESQSFVQKVDCDIKKHAVFSNIAHYVDWIQGIIKVDSSQHWKDIELQCTYGKNYEGYYGCEIENLVVDTPYVRVAGVSGQHVAGNTSKNVEYVWIKNSRTPFLPHFDSRIYFPNLLKYIINDSGLKSIARDNFVGMPKVQTLDLNNNDLETLAEDALYDMKHLVDLYLDNNKLKSLPPKLLSEAPEFQRFKATNNSLTSIDAEFFKQNPILKIVTIDNNKLEKINSDFRGYDNLKRIDLQGNTCIDSYYNDWRKYKTAEIIQKEIEATCR